MLYKSYKNYLAIKDQILLNQNNCVIVSINKKKVPKKRPTPKN